MEQRLTVMPSKTRALYWSVLRISNCTFRQTACESSPCQNGGECKPIYASQGYRCDCNEPYSGENCHELGEWMTRFAHDVVESEGCEYLVGRIVTTASRKKKIRTRLACEAYFSTDTAAPITRKSQLKTVMSNTCNYSSVNGSGEGERRSELLSDRKKNLFMLV